MIKFKLFILFFFSFMVSMLAQKADDLIGTYRLPNKLEIEIFKEGSTYSGKIVSLNGYKNGETKDVKNPDKSRRNDDLVGKVIITNLTFDGSAKKWLKGKLYGPDKGMSLSVKITKLEDDKATAVGSKYFFWRTFEWEKI